MNYLLLAATATALFFAAYWLLMRREKRHQMVRFYLLGTLLLAFLLPAVHLHIAVPHQYVMNEGATGIFPTLTYQTAETSPTGQTSPILQADINWLLWLWLAGAVAATAILLVRLVSLWRRMRGLPFEECDGVLVALLDDDTPAFSFGRRIVVGTRGFSEAEVQQLVGHERVHVRQRHTADIMFCELAKVVLWFDPFIYLYARELKRVHEYIADSEMMSADYAELFYHQVSGRCYSPLAHSFDYRMVHQRIDMMARQRGSSGWMKPFAALPLVAAVLLAGCTPKSNSLLVGQWEYVEVNREYIYDDGNTSFNITEDGANETHNLNELDFHADGTGTVMSWDLTKLADSITNLKPGYNLEYAPYTIEWQIVADSLLLRNDKGDYEALRIVSLDNEKLVFVSSNLFRLTNSGNGVIRETYTYRRKK